jgi:hypothetical protein
MARCLTVFLEALPASAGVPDRGRNRGSVRTALHLADRTARLGWDLARPGPRRQRWIRRRGCQPAPCFQRQGAVALARTRPPAAASAWEGYDATGTR